MPGGRGLGCQGVGHLNLLCMVEVHSHMVAFLTISDMLNLNIRNIMRIILNYSRGNRSVSKIFGQV